MVDDHLEIIEQFIQELAATRSEIGFKEPLPVVGGEGTQCRHLEGSESRIIGEIECGGRNEIPELGQASQ